jgi:hypothetical protein
MATEFVLFFLFEQTESRSNDFDFGAARFKSGLETPLASTELPVSSSVPSSNYQNNSYFFNYRFLPHPFKFIPL